MNPHMVVFVAPNCPWCAKVEQRLRDRGMTFVRRDVTADWDALRWLLRVTGRPMVPAVVAYGYAVVGFDSARLDELIDITPPRAEAYAIDEAEQEQELIASDEAIRRGLGEEADLPVPELEGVPPLRDDLP